MGIPYFIIGEQKLPAAVSDLKSSAAAGRTTIYLNTLFRNHAKRLWIAVDINADTTPAIIVSIISMFAISFLQSLKNMAKRPRHRIFRCKDYVWRSPQIIPCAPAFMGFTFFETNKRLKIAQIKNAPKAQKNHINILYTEYFYIKNDILLYFLDDTSDSK